jgi:hypothetical protein
MRFSQLLSLFWTLGREEMELLEDKMLLFPCRKLKSLMSGSSVLWPPSYSVELIISA